jgi:hypothetical protein
MGNVTRNLVSWGGARAARRLSRSMPWIGGAIAILTIAGSIRRKGLVGGTVDTGLDSIPFIGALKAAFEVARGRDFIPDKPARTNRQTPAQDVQTTQERSAG